MKKVLIYLFILILLSCSIEDPLTETLEKELVTTITINESNITGPMPSIASEPSTLNKSLFKVAIPFSLTNGGQGTTSLKNITVNYIEFDVVKYECNTPELNGSFTFNTRQSLFILAKFKENTNELPVYYNSEHLENIGKKLSSDFLKTNGTIMYLQGSIDNGSLPFEVRLTFHLNATLEVIK
jgi:hypothetical protein